MNRWDYLRFVLMPAAFELWQIEDSGLAVDADAVVRHRERLLNEEANLISKIIEMPLVAKALSDRQSKSEEELNRLILARDLELQELNEPILVLRAENPKVKGTRLTRKSSYTGRISKARLEHSRCNQFNPGSSKQKSWLLYDVFKLPIQYNKKGSNAKAKEKAITTDSRALERLCRRKEVSQEIKQVIKALQEYESTNQIRTTFIDSAIREGRDRNSITTDDIRPRIYSAYGLHRTGSGRVASGSDKDEKAGGSDTNAQNQPKITRDIYIPDPGFCFVQGDWSQVEWLNTLILSGDQESFQKAITGEDRHKRYAVEIFGKKYEEITEDERQFAKSKCTYAISYGAGARRISEETGLSVSEASRILRAAKAAFPKVTQWQEETIAIAKQQHWLRTVYGWQRWFWDVDSDIGKVINFLPQATCADMLKIVLPDAGTLARSLGGRLASTTHDSILAMVPIKTVEVMIQKLKTIMERPFKKLSDTSFPTKVKSGMTWLEAS